MKDDALAGNEIFLKAGTKLEPLVYGWPVWAHMVAPVQCAANLAFRYLPIMHSFIQNPTVHTAAARDPRLTGGPFIHLSEGEVHHVVERVTDIQCGARRGLEFVKDLRQFDRHVQQSAKGFSLEEMYAIVPQSLRGLIELSYDLNNHPRIRVIEEFVYRDVLTSGAFSVLISRIADEDRPFFMGAPRIRAASETVLHVELSDARIDALSEMRIAPRPASEVHELLGRGPIDASELFTAHPPLRRAPEYSDDAVRVRYFGHACVLVQANGESVLIDPFVAWDRSSKDNRLTFEDLPNRIDYVAITHGHQDHFCVELLMQLRTRIGEIIVPRTNTGDIADPSLALILKHIGFKRVKALERFEEIKTQHGRIISLPFPGEHADLDIHGRQSVLVECCGRKLLFLADSSAADPELYRRLGSLLGQVHVVFIGMECVGAPLSWLYGPLVGSSMSRRDDTSRRLSASNCERAWSFLQNVPSEHVCIYAMGHEPWLQYVMGLKYEENSKQLKEVQQLLGRCMQVGKKAEVLHISREFFL